MTAWCWCPGCGTVRRLTVHGPVVACSDCHRVWLLGEIVEAAYEVGREDLLAERGVDGRR